MFARLFGPKTTNNCIRNSKTIQGIGDSHININQFLWTKLLIDIDLNLSQFHDYPHILLISSPYSIKAVSDSLDDALNKLNLIYISPLVIEYLFGNEKQTLSKLQFSTINISDIMQMTQTMSIIIIDVESSEMARIPTLCTDLIPANSLKNNISSFNDSTHWALRWSTNRTSAMFQNAMNDISAAIQSNKDMMDHFNIYSGKPQCSASTVRSAVQKLEKREDHILRQIERCLEKAKEKSKYDKKSALLQLKKKKEYETQLHSIQRSKLNLETQIMTLEDSHLCYQNYLRRPTTRNIRDIGTESQDMEHLMVKPLVQPTAETDDELELVDRELTELNNIQHITTNDGDKQEVDKSKLSKDELDELAELEAMMN